MTKMPMQECNEVVKGLLAEFASSLILEPAKLAQPVAWMHPTNNTCVATEAWVYEKARPLVHQPATANSAVGERLFALLDLALCGVMNEEQQADLIQQARNRGLLPAA